jgi:Flp pilus assembly protein TadG
MRVFKERRGEHGQALVLFALALTAMLIMSTLLFDGAQSVVLRRRLQGAADSAALAAANIVQIQSPRGCSDVGTTTASSTIRTAVATSLANNLSGTYSTTVACPVGYSNSAVSVSVTATSPSFFGGIVGSTGTAVSADATAVNGQISNTKFAVVELNPYHPGWAKDGCPSVLFSGGPTVIFDGSMQVDSACPANAGGALGTNGNSATLTFNNGSDARLVGGYAPGPLVISPPPVTGQGYVNDPLRGLTPVPLASLTVQSGNKTTLNNKSAVLQPGIYTGGIQLKNSSQAYLLPGIYVMNGGGLDLGAQSSVFAVDSGKSSTTAATWSNDCHVGTCGVLIYNTGSAAMGSITVGAGATLLLKPYVPGLDGLTMDEYRNLLFWQDGSPVPTSAYSQPSVVLNGGGQIDISGTVYAPSAQIFMTGGSGGSGGSSVDLTLQFISWDLQIQGNASFHFYYNSASFAKPLSYGLVQ